MQDGSVDLVRILEDAVAAGAMSEEDDSSIFSKREVKMILHKAGVQWSDTKLSKVLARCVDFDILEPVRALKKTRWGIPHTESCYQIPNGGKESLAKVVLEGDNEGSPTV